MRALVVLIAWFALTLPLCRVAQSLSGAPDRALAWVTEAAEALRAQQSPRLREQLLRDVCANDPGYFKSISPWMIAEGAAAALRDHGMVIRHVVGARDDTRELNRQFHERMAELQIPHEYVELPNVGHDARALLAALRGANGEFYRRVLGRGP